VTALPDASHEVAGPSGRALSLRRGVRLEVFTIA
jgi:hypothetical protein